MPGKTEFTLEELKKYNGQDGQPAYVAYDGKVFDITDSKRWKNGKHMNRHEAGRDLTDDIAIAPHEAGLLDQFPQVGTLKKEEAKRAPAPVEDRLPAFVRVAIEAYPILQRHPHPMVVHFPIVFMISTAIFVLLYLTTGMEAFETTSFHMMGGGVLFTIVAIATGFLTWWINYAARMMTLILIKIVGSFLMFAICTLTFVWRFLDPTVLTAPEGPNLLYVLLALSLFPIVSIVGYCGAELTFPTPESGRKKKKAPTGGNKAKTE